MSAFFVAALTGRSGAGKSLASAFLAEHGVPVLDGDQVARQVVEPGEPCLDELVKAFGADILQPDGTLNRRKLGDICFADPEKKHTLNAITHPHILESMQRTFAALKAAGERCCVVEAAALLESGLDKLCDRIILVTADEDTLVARIMQRDGLTEQQARTRVRSQMNEDVIRAMADAVVVNNGDETALHEQLQALLAKLDGWYHENER